MRLDRYKNLEERALESAVPGGNSAASATAAFAQGKVAAVASIISAHSAEIMKKIDGSTLRAKVKAEVTMTSKRTFGAICTWIYRSWTL